jgi:hypothetical protein
MPIEEEKSQEELSNEEENEEESFEEDEGLEKGLEEAEEFFRTKDFAEFVVPPEVKSFSSALEKVETFEEPSNLEENIENLSINQFSQAQDFLNEQKIENKPIYSADSEELYRIGNQSVEPVVLRPEFRGENNFSRMELSDASRTISGRSDFAEPEILGQEDVDNSKYTSIKD